MWSAVQSGDRASFCALANPFDVGFVILGDEQSAEWYEKMSSFLAPAFGAPGVRIWQVTGCGP
jgi:hypothetical protein